MKIQPTVGNRDYRLFNSVDANGLHSKPPARVDECWRFFANIKEWG